MQALLSTHGALCGCSGHRSVKPALDVEVMPCERPVSPWAKRMSPDCRSEGQSGTKKKSDSLRSLLVFKKYWGKIKTLH